jgi:predicted transcriptional regulator
LAVKSQVIEIVKSKKLEPDFEPSMKTLSRIVKSMTENGAGGKTQLSLDANLNYTRLAKHIVWLEKKGLVESTIKDNKINVVLTTNGMEFASTIAKIS